MKALTASLLALMLVLNPGWADLRAPDREFAQPVPAPVAVGVEVAAGCQRAEAAVVEVADGPTPGVVADVLFPCAETAVVADGPASRLVVVTAAGLAARLGVPFFPDLASAGRAPGRELIVVADQDLRSESPSAAPSAAPTLTPGTPGALVGASVLEMARSISAHTHDRRVILIDDDTRLAEGLREVARRGGILLPASSPGRELAELRAAGFAVTTVSPELANEAGAAREGSPSPTEIPVELLDAPDHPAAGVDLWLSGAEEVAARPWLDVAAAVTREQRVHTAVTDPRTDTGLQQLLVELGDDLVTLRRSATITEWEPWQLATVLSGQQLPGGGFTIFPERRLVAMYGHPTFAGLGVLGEQGPEDAVTRAREIAALYEDGDLPVVPAFDIITTLASGGPTEDGDYSEPLDPDVLRPWIEAATDAGMYVTLDFQPGRSSYIEQVPRYEEFLLLPNVGVALDPEWRLGPTQVHLQQIGSTSAGEINEVADWLSSLVREHALPQKLLVVHQFRLAMIRDRDLLEHPPELAVVIHMDGQGPIATKDETYRAITDGFEDRVWWGWKNFYDEDSPTPSPEHTMSADPAPVFVSYQ